jgi:hypothetical protein
MKTLLSITLLALLAAGCSDAPVASTESDPGPVRISGITPSYAKPEDAGLASVVGPLLHEVNVLFAQSQSNGVAGMDLAQLDAQLDAHRLGVDERHRYEVDQLGSLRMLPMIDLACIADCQELRRKHVDRLLTAGFPDARILEREIDRIGLSEAERSAARRTAASNAERWMEQRGLSKSSPACGDGPLCKEIRASGDEMSEEIVEAAARLRRS